MISSKSDFIHILMILYMYIAPGQGQKTLWGQILDVNRKPLSLRPFVAGLKKNCFEVWFYIHFFQVSPYVYSPRQGDRQSTGDNFDDNRKAYSLCPYVASFKMISSKSDFIHILMILYMYIAPGQGQKTLWGQTLDVNRKPLSLRPFVANFKQISLNSDLYTFLMFFHMYIDQVQGQTTFCGQNPDVNRKALSLCPFVASFKNLSLKSDFIHNFSCFYTCI